MVQENTAWGPVCPTEIKFVPKRWGFERWFVNNEKFCGKELFIAAGRYTSFHWHEIKEEMLYVQKGVLGLIWRPPENDLCFDFDYQRIYSGGGFYATPNTRHQLYAVEGDLTIIETSTQHFDEDSYREETDLMHDFNYGEDFK